MGRLMVYLKNLARGGRYAGAILSAVLVFTGPGLAIPLAAGNGAVPVSPSAAVVIPFGNKPVTVDGVCDTKEYKDALASPFVDGGGSVGWVYLKHDHTSLDICLQANQGSFSQRFASVYLDPDLGGGSIPQADDLALRANFTDGQRSSLQGGGKAGYFVPAAIDGWSVTTQTNGSDTAEYRIPLSLVGCRDTFGLAVYHHWFAGIANDYGWPVSQFWDQPQTWATVVLDKFHDKQCSKPQGKP